MKREMNHKKHSRFAFLLSLLFVVSFLATACGTVTETTPPAASTEASSSEAATESTPAAEESTAPEVETLNPVTLKIITFAYQEQPDLAEVNAAITDYLKDDLNVTFELEPIIIGAWDDRKNLIIASGEPCDLMFTAAWTGFVSNSARGAFLDLTDLVQEYGTKIVSSDYGWYLEAGTIGGKLTGIPGYQQNAQSRGFHLKMDLVKKYGPQVNFKINDYDTGIISEGNTLEQLEKLFEVIKENEPEQLIFFANSGKNIVETGAWERDGTKDAVALDVLGGSTNYVNFYETDFYRNSIEMARRWYLAGYVNEDAAITTDNSLASVAFAAMTNTNVGTAENTTALTGEEIGRYIIAKPFITTALLQGGLWTIPVQSKNPERAMMLLERMHTDKELANMIVYGIEGKHYELVSENVFKTAEGIDPKKLPYSMPVWMFGNQSLLYTREGTDPEFPNQLRNFNINADKSPAFGFTYNSENVRNELAALANVISEFAPGLSTGAVDPYEDNTYDQFLKALKDAGVDKAVADRQVQLDEWLKNR